MKDYISRHTKESAAHTRAEQEAWKAKANTYISNDTKYFYVHAHRVTASDIEVEYVAPQNTRCQHCSADTGSTRASNCPQCSTLKDEVSRGRISYLGYGELLDIFKRLTHLQEDAFHEALKKEIEKERQKGRQREQEEFAAKRRRKEAEEERSRINDFMRPYGYRWNKIPVGTEESWAPGGYGAGIGEFSHWLWELNSPDGRVVDVKQAMEEIEIIVDFPMQIEIYDAAQLLNVHPSSATQILKQNGWNFKGKFDVHGFEIFEK